MENYTFQTDARDFYKDAIHYVEKDFTMLEANEHLMGQQRKMNVNTHALVDKLCDMLDRVESCIISDPNDLRGLRMAIVYYKNSIDNVIQATKTTKNFTFDPVELQVASNEAQIHIKRIDDHDNKSFTL